MNKETKFSIAKADLAAVMHNAISAFLREDWLGQANETFLISQYSVTDFIREKFKPFEDRLIARANGIGEKEQAARNALFVHFTKLAIGDKQNENA